MSAKIAARLCPRQPSMLFDLARKGVEVRRENVKLSERNTDMEAEHVKFCAAAGYMMGGQLEAAERQVTAVTETAG